MADRVSTLFNFNKTIDDFDRTQVKLARLREQISTGQIADSFFQLGGNVTRSLDLTSLIDRADSYVNENVQVSNRLKVMDLALQQIVDIAGDLQDNIVVKRSSTGPSLPLETISRNFLDSVKDRLNSTFDGRFLFAGSKTDILPVTAIQSSNIINGVVTDNYYKGDNVDLTSQISPELTVTYGLRANDPAFQKLIGALHKAIEGNTSGSDATLAEASDLVRDAISGLASLRNSIGNNLKLVQDTSALQESAKTFFQKNLSEVAATDPTKAVTEVSLHETTLQASFQVFARLSNLNLVDFVR